MTHIIVTDRNGKTHRLEAVEGWRVMEILRDHGVGVEGTCGGQCDCASCHVLVDPSWLGKLYPPSEDEEFKLDELPTVKPNSRLSCQIIWEENLDGLKLSLADY
jgi:2Fe-2S ferredoxin